MANVMQRLFFICLLSFWGSASLAAQTLTLSLDEAILLASRENPHVQTQQLADVMQKFALSVQQWMFKPQYTLSAAFTLGTIRANGQPFLNSSTKAISPGVSVLTPIGTQISLAAANTIGQHYNPSISLQVTQPLMRGFGRPIVEAALYNAMDNEKISRLNMENMLRNTVTNVITSYLNVVSAEYTVKISEESLHRSERSAEQTQLLIQGGHKAANELVTVQAEIANAKATLENNKNTLEQARYALLTAIGLDPNTPVSFTSLNIAKLTHRYHVPALVAAKAIALQQNIQYQIDRITFEGATKRNLVTAEDNTRWKLDLTMNAGVGSGTGGGYNAGINSLINGANQTRGASLTLSVPINDQLAKQAVVGAKVAIRQAELQLKQERWSVETNAINSWNSIQSAERALRFAESAEALQEKTYQLNNQKYLYGMIDSLVLQTAQQQLNAAKQALVTAHINYLMALVNLDLITGQTLKTWNIVMKNRETAYES